MFTLILSDTNLDSANYIFKVTVINDPPVFNNTADFKTSFIATLKALTTYTIPPFHDPEGAPLSFSNISLDALGS